jgi:glycine/D-amino acid oxidase-like deaminating enzyme
MAQGATDVLIHGAGVFGLSIGFVCARRGARVHVADPHGLAAGASGGIIGALAPHVPENWNDKKAFQLDSLLMAESFWADVAAVSGAPTGYARTGRIQPLADGRAVALARARVEGAEALWQGRAVWEVRAVHDPGLWPIQPATGLVIHDTLSARIDPRQACLALARGIAALGGTVGTDAAFARAATVWATGHAGLVDLSRVLGAPVGRGVKGQALRLSLPGPDRSGWPQLFVDGLHLVPHEDGTLALGSTSETEFDTPDATDGRLDDLWREARAALPFLEEALIVQRWAGVRPRARSRGPMLGPWPGRPGHFIANGGFKIGFGMAPKAAEVMADLILTGRADIPAGFAVEANL